MKAISLLQPWASLYAHGFKLIETRSWNTKHRGTLLIHASASKKGRKIFEEFKATGHLKGTIFQDMEFDALPFGAIVGHTNIDHVISTNQVREDCGVYYGPRTWQFTSREIKFGDYSSDRYAWLSFGNWPFSEPIKGVKGKLSIWNVPKELQEAVNHQIKIS